MAKKIESLQELKTASVESSEAKAPRKSVKDKFGRTYATGKRKDAVARVWIKPGKGVITVNEKSLDEYFARPVLKMVINQPFVVTNRENEFDVVAQPYVESYDYKIGEDLKITAKIELRPEVTLGEYKGLTVDVEEYKIAEDALEKSLNGMLQQYATTVVVTDRKTKSDDIIVFDFDGYSNGEKIEHGDAKNYTLDLGNSSFIPGFAEQLVDRPLGEEFDIEVKFPEEYHEKKLAGQPATFKCKINEIKTKVLPELNDEFAQKVGPFKTVDDLKADIQKYLDKQKEDIDRVNSEKAIFEKVTSEAKVDIQQSMIDREADELVEEYRQKLTSQGFTWEQAVEAQGYDNIMSQLKEDAQVRVKNSLVIDKIAKAENITVTQEDFMAKLTELSQTYHMDAKTMLKQFSQTPGIFNMLSQQALNEKVTKFLADNNSVKLV